VKLRELEIKDFRSLEGATLAKIKDNNVIVGQNNAGKSSVFAALQAFVGMVRKTVPPASVLTHREQNRAVRFTAIMEPDKAARDAYVLSLVGNQQGNIMPKIMGSKFFSLVKFTFQMVPFESGQGKPRAYLDRMETLSDDGRWIVLQTAEPKATATTNARYKVVDLKARFSRSEPGRLVDRLDLERGNTVIALTGASIRFGSTGNVARLTPWPRQRSSPRRWRTSAHATATSCWRIPLCFWKARAMRWCGARGRSRQPVFELSA
jgi:hypothetical protein